MKISSQIKQGDRGKLCLEFLVEKFKYLTRDEWIERLKEGRFSIEGTLCSSETVLKQHDILIYDAPPFKEPDADLNYSIIMETDDFFAVNKPGNLLVHKKGAAVTHNLIYQLRECHEPPYPSADIVNRLDRETSGIVLISKSKDVLRHLSSLFADRLVEKVYLAVVHGVLEKSSGVIDKSLKPDPNGNIRSRQIVSDDGKHAETRYELVASWDNYSLVRLYPKTGRTHQLRVHMAHLGHTIVGDKLYGLTEDEFNLWRNDPEGFDSLEFPRQALHCCGLRFDYAGTKQQISAPLPDDIKKLIPDGIEIK